jgi:hypothetical protein
MPKCIDGDTCTKIQVSATIRVPYIRSFSMGEDKRWSGVHGECIFERTGDNVRGLCGRSADVTIQEGFPYFIQLEMNAFVKGQNEKSPSEGHRRTLDDVPENDLLCTRDGPKPCMCSLLSSTRIKIRIMI